MYGNFILLFVLALSNKKCVFFLVSKVRSKRETVGGAVAFLYHFLQRILLALRYGGFGWLFFLSLHRLVLFPIEEIKVRRNVNTQIVEPFCASPPLPLFYYPAGVANGLNKLSKKCQSEIWSPGTKSQLNHGDSYSFLTGTWIPENVCPRFLLPRRAESEPDETAASLPSPQLQPRFYPAVFSRGRFLLGPVPLVDLGGL